MSTTPPTEPTATDKASFFGRQTGPFSNWFWVALAVVVTIAFIPRGARRAIESNTNKAEDWLPANYTESADLGWFRDHFVGEQFVLVSWDGCTLGSPERLELLRQKLATVTDDQGDWAWYPKVLTGLETIAELTEAPASLERSTAIRRLEGALVGPQQVEGEQGSRTTCLIAYLAPQLTTNNRLMRTAVERIENIAHKECGIPRESIRMGGPPVDNVTIDIEGERTLIRLAGLAGIVGLVLSYACFRSWQLTGMVFFVAVVNAGLSLALVFYYGVFEVLGLGQETPILGKTDAILMSMPAVVYVLALSGAIHLVNYYRDWRRDHGAFGAPEGAVQIAWGPCLLAALTTAVGLGSLAASDILPIRKFGIFTAVGVVAAVGMLMGMLPLLLHTFPPSDEVLNRTGRKRKRDHAWYEPLANFVTRRSGLTAVACIALMVALAAGLPQIRTSVQLLKLLDERCDLITDYTWLEDNLGNLVPMEVIVAFDDQHLRSPDERADANGSTYRMTMHERAELVRRLQSEIESLPAVSRALSASTFAPTPNESGGSATLRRRTEYTNSVALEDSRNALSEYLCLEQEEGEATGRELWRVSARVTALGDIDYGQFVERLREHVDPVLATYRQRDQVVQLLAAQQQTLAEAKICLIATHAPAEGEPLDPAIELGRLLKRGVTGAVTLLPADRYLAAEGEERAKLDRLLAAQDCLLAVDPTIQTQIASASGSAVSLLSTDTATDAAEAVYTGIVPLVYKTQRQLLISLQESILMATILIAIVMVIVLRSPAAGIASMVPNVFPIVVVFGAIGWLGVKVDIGIMMTASVALGVAVDDTLHFVTWFSRGIRQGLDRRSATLLAFERCATAMVQTTLIGGLGLAVFAASTFTPTQQFGTLMIIMLGAALVGDLLLLPALLCGPVGRFFAPGVPASPEAAALLAATQEYAHAASPEDKDSAEQPTDQPVDVIPFSSPQQSEPEKSSEVAQAGNNDSSAEATRTDEPDSPQNRALYAKLRRIREGGRS